VEAGDERVPKGKGIKNGLNGMKEVLTKGEG
jgi:hypothetical protein